jgi:hypothetical protein
MDSFHTIGISLARRKSPDIACPSFSIYAPPRAGCSPMQKKKKVKKKKIPEFIGKAYHNYQIVLINNSSIAFCVEHF